MQLGRVEVWGLWVVRRVEPGSEALQRLEAKLEPARIRSTLAFAGLFQLTREMIKRSVLDEVKSSYGFSNVMGAPVWLTGRDGEAAHTSKVLALDPKSPFRASLLWLVDSNAITCAQMHVLDRVYQDRHDLTHALGKYLVDLDFEPDLDLFVEAVSILRSISRLWTQIEIDIGTFDEHGDITADEATPLSLVLLQMAIDAYVQGLEDGHQS